MTNMFSKVIVKRVRHQHYSVVLFRANSRHEGVQSFQCNHCEQEELAGAGGNIGKLEWLIDHLRDEHGLVFSSRDWRNKNV